MSWTRVASKKMGQCLTNGCWVIKEHARYPDMLMVCGKCGEPDYNNLHFVSYGNVKELKQLVKRIESAMAVMI